MVCDDSSGDDDDLGIVKVKLGAEDAGSLGIEFQEISIRSVNPTGMAQSRAARPLVPGMVLRAINGVPVERLAYNAVLELTGHEGADIRGLTLTLQHAEEVGILAQNQQTGDLLIDDMHSEPEPDQDQHIEPEPESNMEEL